MSLADLIADRAFPVESHWLADPAGWVSEKLGEHFWSGQVSIAESVRDHRLTAVKACHGPGKSFSAARIAAWWIDTHPPGTAMVVSTAPTWPQVSGILWREIRKAWRKGNLPGTVLQTCEWKLDNGDLVGLGRKPADHDEHGFQGIHARYVLVIIDEACGVPQQIWNAVHALATNDDCRVLAIGNPDDPASHFATICQPDSGWEVLTISVFDTPNFTGETIPDELRPLLPNHSWVEECERMWGTESPVYTSKVLGEFPESAEDSVIPLGWVRAAQDRWAEWAEGGRRHGPADQFGVDVAGGGADRTVIATRYGWVVDTLEQWQGDDTRSTMVTAGRVAQKLHGGGTAVVDWTGLGQGVHDRLVEQGLRSVAFVAGKKTDYVDSTGQVGFVSCKAAAWWALRELLHPETGPGVCLPPDDQLAAELCAPKWQLTSTGKIRVESKDDVKDRIGRSTDLADAVVLAFWPDIPAEGAGDIYEATDLDPDLEVSISPY